MDFAARIGIAFHGTLESMDEDPPNDGSLSAVAQEAGRRFRDQIERQRHESSCRPREQFLPQDETRINAAAEGVVSEAIRLARLGLLKPKRHLRLTDAKKKELQAAEVEVYVRSRDGLFQGLIDRVEHTPFGARLIDVKSALRTDLPERYERQVQMYAYLWNETRREWPAEAIVIFPLTGRHFSVQIDRELVAAVMVDSAQVIRSLDQRGWANRATPGDVCKVCEFRPWCERFWVWVSEEHPWAIRTQRANLGWQGLVEEVDRDDQNWRLRLKWQSLTVNVSAPFDGFAHIQQARPGMAIRMLDVRLRGAPQYLQATAEGKSEIFLVRSPNQN